MIAPWQPVYLGLRDRLGIEVGMRRWGRLVHQAMEHVHGHAGRKPRAEILRQLELVTEPAAIADERRCDQHDRLEFTLRRLLGKRVDQDCRAHRMPDHDRPIVQVRHRTSDRRAPPSDTGVILVGHARIADLGPVPVRGNLGLQVIGNSGVFDF